MINNMTEPSRRSPRRLARLLVVIAVMASGACANDRPWNVLVVSFDTTRADHIGCYGHAGAQTPNINGLAEEGTRFDRAYTAVPITLPSHSTIFTGTYPMQHGVRDNGVFVLADRNLTLAEMLSNAGYATAAAIGSFPLTSKFGINQGFDLFDDRVAQLQEDVFGERVRARPSLFFDERPAGLVNEAILPWMREHRDEPFFLWAHYFDPHQPFAPPPPYDQLFASDLYLGEIAYADESLGVLLSELESLGIADRTMVVFVSDHGEGLGDHNESTHSILNYNSTLRVPLIVKIPGGFKREVDTRVGTVDIVPTVLELLGLEIPDVVQGTSRASDVLGISTTPPGNLYAETLSPRIAHGWGELRTLFFDDLKYIHGPRPELYDLGVDPGEFSNLMDLRPDEGEKLRLILADFIDDHASDEAGSAVEMDEATRRQLEALGYLHDSSVASGEIIEQLREDGAVPQDRVVNLNLLSSAKQYLYAGRALVARDAALELLQTEPDNSAYLEVLAMAEIEIGRLEVAYDIVRGMDSLVQNGDVSRRLMIQIGAAYLFQGDAETALEMISRALAIEETAQAFYIKALACAHLGRADDEIVALRAAIDQDRSFSPGWINLAIRQAQRGDLDDARSSFETAVISQPYDPRAAYNYGTFLVQSGELENAAARFERAVQLSPAYLQAQHALAVVSADLGRWGRVREIDELLARRAPESVEAAAVRELLEEIS